MSRQGGKYYRAIERLLAATMVTFSMSIVYASPCIEDGLATYRQRGALASYPVFRERLEDPACVQSLILLLNYARVIEEIVDDSGDDPRTCEAVEVYTQVALQSRTSRSMRALGQRGVQKLDARCTAYIKRQNPDDYLRIISRADSLRGASRLRAAALDFKTAYRLNPRRREAPLALCEILPRIDRHAEAEPFCQPSENTQPVSAGTDIPNIASPSDVQGFPWILTSSAVVALAAGGVLTAFSLSKADDAWAARKLGESAQRNGDANKVREAIRTINESNQDAKLFEYTAWSLYGVGAVLGMIAIYKGVSSSDDSDDSDGFSLGLGHILYQTRW